MKRAAFVIYITPSVNALLVGIYYMLGLVGMLPSKSSSVLIAMNIHVPLFIQTLPQPCETLIIITIIIIIIIDSAL